MKCARYPSFFSHNEAQTELEISWFTTASEVYPVVVPCRTFVQRIVNYNDLPLLPWLYRLLRQLDLDATTVWRCIVNDEFVISDILEGVNNCLGAGTLRERPYVCNSGIQLERSLLFFLVCSPVGKGKSAGTQNGKACQDEFLKHVVVHYGE